MKQSSTAFATPRPLSKGDELETWRKRSALDRKELLHFFEGSFLEARERILRFVTDTFDLRYDVSFDTIDQGRPVGFTATNKSRAQVS